MSVRKVVTIREPDFPSALTESRARDLVSSGLIDLAAEITALSHHLTDSVMAMLDADASERDIFIADYCALRTAVWEGIATGILQHLEQTDQR